MQRRCLDGSTCPIARSLDSVGGLVDAVDCAGCDVGSTKVQRFSAESGAGKERVDGAAEEAGGRWGDDDGSGSGWDLVSGVSADGEGRGSAAGAGGDAAVGRTVFVCAGEPHTELVGRSSGKGLEQIKVRDADGTELGVADLTLAAVS